MSYILGVNTSHNPSVCLINKNKDIIYFGELLNKYLESFHKSNWNMQPILSELFDVIGKQSIDHIVFGSVRAVPDSLDIDCYKLILEQIKKGCEVKEVKWFPDHHHLYHAIRAKHLSNFEECAALVSDGFGTYMGNNPNYREIESIYKLDNNGGSAVYKHYSNSFKNSEDKYTQFSTNNIGTDYLISNAVSPGMLFANMVVALKIGSSGFDSGKLSDLAMQSSTNFTSTSWSTGLHGYSVMSIDANQCDKIGLKTKDKDKACVAKKLHYETKEHTNKLIRKAVEKTGCKNIVLSGGYFMNKINNPAYIKDNPDLNIFIDPIAHDAGTAMGAALYYRDLLNGLVYKK